MPKSAEKKNTFRFQTFEELIQVDILLKKRAKLDAKEESHLAQCFNKWTTMNCSLEFIELRNKLGPKIITLDLLLINEQEVVNILFESIEKCTSISCIAVMDLLQNLVCDIREDFLPHLERSFLLITGVIERVENDADMLLSAFSCIAHILSFLDRLLIKDIQQLLLLIKPLLFHKRKYYIRNFTAQSLAYLLRKCKDFKSVFSKNILTDLIDGNTDKIYSDAIGHLMSSCIKTMDSIYSSGPKLFINYYEILHERQDEFFIHCFDEMFKCVLYKLSVVGYRDLWKLIVDQISIINDEKSPDELSLLVLELFFKHAHTKSLLSVVKPIVDHIKELIRGNPSNRLIEISKIIVNKLPFSSDINGILRALIACKEMDIESKFQLAEEYINYDNLEMIVKNSLNDYLSTFIKESWLKSDKENFRIILKSMTKLVLKKFPIAHQSQWNKSIGQINFNLFIIEDETEALQKRMIKVIKEEYSGEDYEEILWMTIIVIPHFYPMNVDRTVMECLQNKLKPLIKLEISSDLLIKINSIFECIVQLNSFHEGIEISIDLNKFINLIDEYEFNSPLEPVLLEIIYKSLAVDQNPENFSNHFPVFIKKLKSPHHQTRLSSIRILQRIYRNDHSVKYSLNVCEEIEKLYELHETELVKKERSVINFLNQISYRPEMANLAKEIIINFLVGSLHVQLSSLWNHIGQTLTSFYLPDQDKEKSLKSNQAENENIIWSVTKTQLDYCQKMTTSSMETDNEIKFYCDLHNKYIMDKFYRSRSANWLQMRLNIVKFLTRIPELAAKRTVTLSPLLISIYTDEYCTKKSPRQIRENTLISMMVLYSKFPNISCTNSEKLLRNLYYKCLASKKSSIQLAAFEVLVNYKIPELHQYRLQIIEYLKDNKDELKNISLSLIQPGHRQIMVPIMLRIVVGKLKSIGKLKKKNHLISYLLELEQSEMGLLMSILMEGLKVKDYKYEIVNPDEDIQKITEKIRQSITEGQLPPFVTHAIFKTLHGVSVILNMILESLVNKLSNDNLTKILRVILDFYACCHYQRGLKSDSSTNLKVLRQICAKMVLFYFNKIETFEWTEMLMDEITKLMIDPHIEKLVEENQNSVNIAIQLCTIWSEKEQFITRITPRLIECIIELMLKPKLNREKVGYNLVTIIHNIMQNKKYSEHFQSTIISNISAIIQYLAGRIRFIKLKKLSKINSEMTVTRKELEMITICVDYILKNEEVDIDQENILSMINCMLVFLYKTNNLILTCSETTEVTEETSNEIKEQLEVDFLHAIQSLSNVVDVKKILNYFERFLGLFSRFRKRASRVVLSNFISKLWARLSEIFHVADQFKNLGEVAIKLNSWNERRLEEMDFDLICKTIVETNHIVNTLPIKESVENLAVACQTNIHPNLWVYYLVSQNCLFFLSEVGEFETRMVSQDFLNSLIRSIAESNNEKILQALFYDNIWPALRNGIANKKDLFYKSFIGLIKTVVEVLGKTTRFEDIAKLAVSDSEEMKCFFDNMLSMTPALISKGLRQLIKFLGKHSVSSINVKEILLPLVWKRIEVISEEYNTKDRSTLTNTHRESLVSSFDAVTAIAKQLPTEMYEKIITEQLVKLNKGGNIELRIKTIIALLNGYNCEKYEEKSNHSFMVGVLGELEKHLSKRIPGQDRHKHAQKSNMKNDLMNPKDAEWTVRGIALQVPIALAIVNVVLRLPKNYMKATITKVILKICEFLKAHEIEVRKESGTTLSHILEILNSPQLAPIGTVRYLGFFIQTVKNNLNQGFQRHVGLFTCHGVLQRLHEKKFFERLSVDDSTIKNMCDMYLDELFGKMAKEKEERATAEKGIVREAKDIRAFEGFRLLSNILEKKHILDFFKVIIQTSQGYKSDSYLRKVQQIFDSIQSKGGLLKNKNLSPQTLFEISFILISEHSDSLFNFEEESKILKENYQISGPENFHLYKPTKRFDEDQGPKMSNLRSCSHLIVNHGLSLLYKLCKLFNSSLEIDLASMLDPILKFVINILQNVQYKTIMLSGIKCINEIIRVGPPSLSDKLDEVYKLLFTIHDKNAIHTDIKDVLRENISTILFKTIIQFIQKPGVKLHKNQYKVLLLGVYLDSQNKEREMKSFDLLKAVIESRIREPIKNENMIVLTDDSLDEQLKDIMMNVRKITLISSREKERNEARSSMVSYLKYYKQSKEYIQEYILFMFKQMVSLTEDGQLSGCLMIQSIFKLYSPSDIDMDSFSPCIIVSINIIMQSGTTEKVQKVLDVLISEVMSLVTTDKQGTLCNMVFWHISEFKHDDNKLSIAFHIMSIMLKAIPTENRKSNAFRFLNISIDNLPCLLEFSEKMEEQFIAAKGQDSDIMAEIVEKSKKQKLEDQINEKIESSEELSLKLTTVIENINAVLSGLASLINVNFDDHMEVEIMRETINLGLTKNVWEQIIDKVLRSKHSKLRLNATKNIINPLLSYEQQYNNVDDFHVWSMKNMNSLIKASFHQLKNDQITLEECNGVLVNIILVWQIVIQNFPDEIKSEFCQNMIKMANYVANDELMNGTTIIKRCAILKFLASVSMKTKFEDLEKFNLKRKIMKMWLREERQSLNDKSLNHKKIGIKKKREMITPQEISDWKNLVSEVGAYIRNCFGEEKCKILIINIEKERKSEKLKRKISESALGVSNPGEALRKKIKKTKRTV